MAEKIIYKNAEAKNKGGLTKRIDELMEIPSDRVVTFFASQDGTNRPDHKPQYAKYYDMEAFYLDRREDKRFPRHWPDELQEEFRSITNSCEHFIWISKRIGEAEEIHFALVYCHELQHLKQCLKNEKLLIIGKLLEYNDNYDDFNIDSPIEVECEAKAKEILVKQLYDQETFDDFIERMKKRGPYERKRYGRLQKLNIPTDFDVEREIQQDICKNKEYLKKIQKQRVDIGKTDWKIDVDKLCSCRDPHEAIISAVSKLNQDGDLL